MSSMHLPMVSVIIPLYNRAEVVLEAVKSALNQSYDNIELIVVDDGSTDESLEKLAEIDDSRLRIVSQKNQGACVARNHGITVARGKYVALLDSDDSFFPQHISDSVAALEAGPGLRVVYGQVVVDRGGGRTFLKPPRPLRDGEQVCEYLLADFGFMQTSTLVLNRELALRVLYREGLRFGQDTDFAIRLAAAGASFHMLAVPQARWRDVADPKRVSSSFDPSIRTDWHRSVHDVLTARAVRADLGWHVAKCYSRQGRWWKASALYAKALFSGCYSPELAARVFLQVFVSTAGYRRLADWVISRR